MEPTEISVPAAALPKARKLSSLAMIWQFAIAYPGKIAGAALALGVAAAATLAIPWQFKAMIDSGFVAGAATSRRISAIST